MINLGKDAKPDFVGTWYQKGADGAKKGNFEIYILEVLGNNFYGITTDTNGIAEIEGEFSKNETIFTKTYARYVVAHTDAAPLPLAYSISKNIFDLEEEQEYEGKWEYMGYPIADKFTVQSKTGLKYSPQEPKEDDIPF